MVCDFINKFIKSFTLTTGDKSYEVTEDFSGAEIWYDLVKSKEKFHTLVISNKGE